MAFIGNIGVRKFGAIQQVNHITPPHTHNGVKRVVKAHFAKLYLKRPTWVRNRLSVYYKSHYSNAVSM